MIARLDLERCVVFSLGVLAILYANNISDYTPIYDSKSHEIKQSALSNLTKQCRKRLSDKLIALLSQMTQETPTKRINFNQLLESLQISSLQNSQNSEEAKGVPEL
jgi:Ca2+-binding EF-hand superfamily protein